MIVLSVFSIISGYIFYDLFIGYGGDLLNLSNSFTTNYLIDLEYLSQPRKFVPLFFVFLGASTYIFFHILFVK
jgi:hypothetical protein